MRIAASMIGRCTRTRDEFLALAARAAAPSLAAWCAGIAACCFALYLSLTPPALQTGDAARYLQTIRGWAQSETPVHAGYYALGKAWFFATSWIFASDERCLNALSAAVAAAGSFLSGLLGWRLLGSAVGAVFAQLSLSLAYFFVLQAVFAEVYIVQMTALLSALLLLLSRRVLPGALAFAFAVTVSPSSLFFLPVLLLVLRRFREVVLFGFLSLALVAAVVVPLWRDYFLGDRGLLRAAGIHLGVAGALRKELVELARFGPALLLIPAGLCVLAGRPAGRFVLCLVAASWLAHFVAGERFDDVPVQFPTYALLLLSCGAAAAWLADRADARGRRAAALAGLALFAVACGVLSATRAAKAGAVARQWRAACASIVSNGPHRVVAEWSPGTLFEHYAKRDYLTGVWINCENLRGTWGASRRDESAVLLQDAIAKREAIWIVDAPPAWAMEAITAGGYDLAARNGLSVALPRAAQGRGAGTP